MEACGAVGQSACALALACQSELAHVLHPLLAEWHVVDFPRRGVAEPQAIAGFLMDELHRAIPLMEKRPRLGFSLHKLFHLLLFEEVVAAVDGLVADVEHVAKRTASVGRSTPKTLPKRSSQNRWLSPFS